MAIYRKIMFTSLIEKKEKDKLHNTARNNTNVFFSRFNLMTIISNQMHIVLHNKKQQIGKRINIVLESETFLLQKKKIK